MHAKNAALIVALVSAFAIQAVPTPLSTTTNLQVRQGNSGGGGSEGGDDPCKDCPGGGKKIHKSRSEIHDDDPHGSFAKSHDYGESKRLKSRGLSTRSDTGDESSGPYGGSKRQESRELTTRSDSLSTSTILQVRGGLRDGDYGGQHQGDTDFSQGKKRYIPRGEGDLNVDGYQTRPQPRSEVVPSKGSGNGRQHAQNQNDRRSEVESSHSGQSVSKIHYHRRGDRGSSSHESPEGPSSPIHH